MLESITEINTEDKTNINKVDISNLINPNKTAEWKESVWKAVSLVTTQSRCHGQTWSLLSQGARLMCCKTYSYKSCENGLVSAGFKEASWLLCLGTQLYVTVNHLEQVAVCQGDAAQPQFSRSARWVREMLIWILDELKWGVAVVPSLNLASLKTESDTAGFGNTIFSQIFPLCYREPFALLPNLVPSNGDIIVYTSALSL